tara:strand:+ start:61992 stop:62600 length:609 start_codon:yes stop_codon:yes gene_type:complete
MPRVSLFAILALCVSITACSSIGIAPADLSAFEQTRVVDPSSLPQENVIEPGCVPTPFSAKQIHDAMPEYGGRYYALRGDSESSMVYYHFDNITATDCSVETMFFDHEGLTSDTKTEHHVLWTDLQKHASFARDEITITEVRLALIAGTFDCWNYTRDDASPGRDELYFAKDLPGPPVYMRKIDAAGAVVFEMELRDFAPVK